MTGFIWKFIICRFGILHSTVTDNGKQFDNARLTSFCEVLDIRKYFSMPNHPRANGQVKAVNKIIKHTLKAKHDALNGDGLRSSQRVMVLLHHKENQLERNHILPSLWCRGCNPARSWDFIVPHSYLQWRWESNGLREKLDLVEERRNCKVLQSKGSEARIWSWVPHPVKGVPRHKRGRAKISRPQLGGTLSGDQNPPQGSLRTEGYGGKTHSPSLERWTSHENITSRGKNVL